MPFWSAGLALDFGCALARALARDRDLALHSDRAPARALSLDPDRARARALSRALSLARTLHSDPDRDLALDSALAWHKKLPAGEPLLASHFLQECFFPNLRESWPPLGLYTRDGMIGDSTLTAPAACHFSPQRETELEELEYDLCFPLTVVPLARLRKSCPQWITDRQLRPAATLPFLFPAKASIWKKHLAYFRERLGVESLYALIPAEALWWKPFADWTEDDLARPDNLSLLWNIETGVVLACKGAVHRDKIKPGSPGVTPFIDYAEAYVESSGKGRQSTSGG